MSSDSKEDQSAPIFLQWLDCLHQLLFQNPKKFEFNMSLLLFLAFHHQNCLYGTFIFNSQKERKENNFRKTVSIWCDVLENKDTFRNPFYDDNKNTPIYDYSNYKIRFWEEYFLMNNFSYTIRSGNINFHQKIIVNSSL